MKAEQLAGLHGERHVVGGGEVAEALDQSVDLDGNAGSRAVGMGIPAIMRPVVSQLSVRPEALAAGRRGQPVSAERCRSRWAATLARVAQRSEQ